MVEGQMWPVGILLEVTDMQGMQGRDPRVQGLGRRQIGQRERSMLKDERSL